MLILESIKSLMGIADDAFDQDILIHINTVFSILNHLGVGPKEPFFLRNGEDKDWSEFINDKTKIEMVKSYVYFKVLIMFDPPTSNAALDAINGNIHELEWRLNSIEDMEV
nr:MAG TPA: hypothetical protein [Caudoviricetes sp.]